MCIVSILLVKTLCASQGMRRPFYEQVFDFSSHPKDCRIESQGLFLLTFELDAASLSFVESKLSMCLHRRIARPLVGEYHVKGIRTPGSIETALTEPSAWVVVNSWKFPFVRFANIDELAVGCYAVGNRSLIVMPFFSKWRGYKSRLPSKGVTGLWQSAESIGRVWRCDIKTIPHDFWKIMRTNYYRLS